MQFQSQGNRKLGVHVLNAHAVLVSILLPASVEGSCPTGGEEAEKPQNKERRHAQKGNERELNRHMGTLSISVHEDGRVRPKPSSLGIQTQEVGRQGTFKSPDHRLRAC